MRKFTMDNVKLTVKLIFLLFTFYILHSTFYIPAGYAKESSPSADIKQKLEELKKEIASKAAQLKQEVNQKLQNKAYVGNVKTKTDNSLTLATKTGPKIVSINQDTQYDSTIKSKVKFSAKTLREEDYLAALGDIDDNGVLTAKKVILLNPQPEPKTYLWGQVISISDRLVTVRDREYKTYTVSISSKTDIFSGESAVNFGELSTNDFVILSGYVNEKAILETGYIYIIPQGGVLRSKFKSATQSAQEATPQAKKKNQ